MKQLLANLRLIWQCYPIAKARVLAHSESKYLGTVRMQIAYNEVRTSLVNAKVKEENITGAVVYLAISLAYLLNVKSKP
jgi:hypothetical protein